MSSIVFINLIFEVILLFMTISGEAKNVFGGMDKEELLKYAKDPFWVRLRWFLFITFWVCWAAMLVGAIMIIYEAPKCEPPAPRTW